LKVIVDCFFTSHFFSFFILFYKLGNVDLDEEWKRRRLEYKLAPLTCDEYNLLIHYFLLDPQCRLPSSTRMILLSRVLENTEVYFESYC
jgi:hypothetical protein